jgi:hypothetical protein
MHRNLGRRRTGSPSFICWTACGQFSALAVSIAKFPKCLHAIEEPVALFDRPETLHVLLRFSIMSLSSARARLYRLRLIRIPPRPRFPSE